MLVTMSARECQSSCDEGDDGNAVREELILHILGRAIVETPSVT